MYLTNTILGVGPGRLDHNHMYWIIIICTKGEFNQLEMIRKFNFEQQSDKIARCAGENFEIHLINMVRECNFEQKFTQ